LNRSKALVTGGAGFIGSHLVERLLEGMTEVVVADNLSNSSGENLEAVKQDTSFIKIDTRSESFFDFLEQESFDVIFHLAGNAYVPPSVRDPRYDLDLNFSPLFRILEFLKERQSDTALIFTSSAAVYGNPLYLPIKEIHPTVPISPYGVGKLAGERYMAVFSELYGLRTASVRLFSIYGPRQEKQLVYDFMVKLRKTSGLLEVLGNGRQTRDLVYVKDVAGALCTVWENGKLAGEVYNIATGKENSTAEIAQAVTESMGFQPNITFTGKTRGGDPERWCGDNEQLAKIGFKKFMPLREGLEETVRWFGSCFGATTLKKWTDPASH